MIGDAGHVNLIDEPLLPILVCRGEGHAEAIFIRSGKDGGRVVWRRAAMPESGNRADHRCTSCRTDPGVAVITPEPRVGRGTCTAGGRVLTVAGQGRRCRRAIARAYAGSRRSRRRQRIDATSEGKRWLETYQSISVTSLPRESSRLEAVEEGFRAPGAVATDANGPTSSSQYCPCGSADQGREDGSSHRAKSIRRRNRVTAATPRDGR